MKRQRRESQLVKKMKRRKSTKKINAQIAYTNQQIIKLTPEKREKIIQKFEKKLKGIPHKIKVSGRDSHVGIIYVYIIGITYDMIYDPPHIINDFPKSVIVGNYKIKKEHMDALKSSDKIPK